MFNRRALAATSLMVALVFSAGLYAQKDDKKQQEAQKKEIQAIVKLVDEASASGQLPNDLGVTWARTDFLKAQGNKEYCPFIVTIDPSKVPGGNVAFYWRVVAKSAAAAEPAADAKTNGKKDDKKDKSSKYAYEDISFVPVQAGQNPMRIDRSFTVPAGDYDVYVVAKEPASQDKKAPAPKVSIIKQSVTVPDFWNGELNTSSVIIAQKIEPLTAPLTPQQQADRPYAMGSMEIVPAVDMKFAKNQELSTFMLIYNPKIDETTKKPDVTVEYNFYSKPKDGAEKFFNKTNPQNLNAQTLPPQFDMAAGHQLQSGQAVPLATFPAGDYRLEIKVTDKAAGGKTLTRDVNFSVTGS